MSHQQLDDEVEQAFTPPFRIGQQLWMPIGDAEKVTVPCPVCAGQLAVTVILGTGERVGVVCDACGVGFDGPRGFIEEYEHQPRTVPFVIASVDSFHGGRWRLRSAAGGSHDFDDLYATEAEALAVATKRAAERHESNMQSRQHKRQSPRRYVWSIRYHRQQIADLERQIAWHKARISAPTKAEGR